MIVGTLGAVPLILGTNSSKRVHIAADGKVGIRTANPSALLHVDGTATEDAFSAYGVDAA